MQKSSRSLEERGKHAGAELPLSYPGIFRSFRWEGVCEPGSQLPAICAFTDTARLLPAACSEGRTSARVNLTHCTVVSRPGGFERTMAVGLCAGNHAERWAWQYQSYRAALGPPTSWISYSLLRERSPMRIASVRSASWNCYIQIELFQSALLQRFRFRQFSLFSLTPFLPFFLGGLRVEPCG